MRRTAAKKQEGPLNPHTKGRKGKIRPSSHALPYLSSSPPPPLFIPHKSSQRKSLFSFPPPAPALNSSQRSNYQHFSSSLFWGREGPPGGLLPLFLFTGNWAKDCSTGGSFLSTEKKKKKEKPAISALCWEGREKALIYRERTGRGGGRGKEEEEEEEEEKICEWDEKGKEEASVHRSAIAPPATVGFMKLSYFAFYFKKTFFSTLMMSHFLINDCVFELSMLFLGNWPPSFLGKWVK